MSAGVARTLSTPAKIAYLPTEGAPMVPYPIGAPSIEKTALFSRSRPGETRLKTTHFLRKRKTSDETTMSMI